MTGAPIDYTRIGYDALREAMLKLARERLPEWTDQSEGDLGVLLIELFAYAADLTLYYQTRIAANLLPETSDEPDALIQLLRLIGYELRPPAPATTDLELAFDETVSTPIHVPAGTRFTVGAPGGRQLVFETAADLAIGADQLAPTGVDGLRRFFPLPVVHGETVLNELVGVSDGSVNQVHRLKQQPVIRDSVTVTMAEPGGVTRWAAVSTLATSSPADRHFIIRRDAAGGAELRFGDGINGMAPPSADATSPVQILTTYRVGGGRLGNVAGGQTFVPSLQEIRAAVNAHPASGGADAEELDRARALAPRLFRAQERAVTLDDHVDLARQVPGVGKVKAAATNWNDILLYVAPHGRIGPPGELLRRELLAHFERHRMATTSVSVVGPAPCDIYLGAVIHVQPYVRQSDARKAVEASIDSYLSFDNVDFGQPVYLSRVYDLLQDLDQVVSLTVFKFGRHPQLPADIVDRPDIETSGIITPGPFEIPRPGYRDAPPASAGYDLSAQPTIFTVIQGGVP
ncbi:putative baseplate assembly protein [Streptomyces sp. NPDC004980]